MTNAEKLAQLKNDLDSIYAVMPTNETQLRNRNRAAFLVCAEIEKLENPIAYAENKNHWDGHEIRF